MQQGFQQVQKLTQNLVLAPQLRQSLKILQAPAMELRNAILEELQTNPLLEELPLESGLSLDHPPGSDDSDRASDSASDGEPAELEFAENFRVLRELSEDWREFYAQENANSIYTSEDAERRQHFFDSIVAHTSLQEHLIRQAELSDLDSQELEAMRFLVGSLDERGFFTSTPQDVALLSHLPVRAVQKALEVLRTFEPPGIASPDLRECLLTQLKAKGRQKSLAFRILKNHFDLLLRRRVPEIARKTGDSPEDVHAALEEIASLDPAPGRQFNEDTNLVVEPDVRVENENGEWKIHLNSDYIPRLRLNQTYKDLIAKGTLSSKEKEYIRDKMRSGKFLINSVEQRQQTIERITREILEFQSGFFERGVSGLKPLTMNQVAQKVGVHETTVSRAIANKFLETPFGTFEFKYFFTPGFTSDDGRTLSNTSIKEMIADVVASENPEKPFSDQEIVAILTEKNLHVARRTVAKYREEMGILPTNLRRRYR